MSSLTSVDQQILWLPSEEKIKNSNLTRFIRFVNDSFSLKLSGYDQLYEWSVDQIENFWEAVWNFSGLIHSKSYNRVLDRRIMPGAKWFEGARLNFAENLLRYRDERIAIISARENSETIRLTYKDLFLNVAKVTTFLRKTGLDVGDRVAGFLSNTPEAVIAMLASTSLGALWSSTSPDFGLKGVLDRFGQISPRILFATEGYFYNGKFIDCREKIFQITENISSIEKVIIVPQFFDFKNYETVQDKYWKEKDKFFLFPELLNEKADEIEFQQLPFDHPVYIMYSSGTTGVPKCIVHGAGGTLLQHFKEHSLHTDLKREDLITYYTTCGWMMWNWLVSALQIGAGIYLYDGSPVYPGVNLMWEKIEKEKITVFGTSPKYLTICEKSEIIPRQIYKLETLRCILSTGSPLTDSNFKWVYSNVKTDLQLSSISGGTDIISCFMLGNPIKPVRTGEIQTRGLGMKVETFNEDGERTENEKGELVCTEPFPSMPVFFWNDSDGKKYRSAYFETFPGVWRHGDYIKITSNGGVIVYGRSDATLNPGGVRIGTAEIYRIVENLDEIADSLVIGQNYKDDVRVILFVVLKNDLKLNRELEDKIKYEIRKEASPRHVPSKIIQISEVPYTINGKKVELAVTKIIHGESVKNKDALVNPEALEQFKNVNKLLAN